ncbi:hypothetical protein KEC48_09850 [Clostridium sp. C1]|uniref:hypothetical protein n=1 Tax=Bacillota TaxID=1239 RepID=UPI001BA62D14|nr:hypothetical protein [Clostridium sp. C1]QUN11794.1 hypothetical protein KEC48_09850 [Clostridium sp. C1]
MCNQCQQKIYQFKYDYFFHYLLIYSSRLRCFYASIYQGITRFKRHMLEIVKLLKVLIKIRN